MKSVIRPVNQTEKEIIEQVELKSSKKPEPVQVAVSEESSVQVQVPIKVIRDEINDVEKGVIKPGKITKVIKKTEERPMLGLDQVIDIGDSVKSKVEETPTRGSKELLKDKPKSWIEEQMKRKPVSKPTKQIEKEKMEPVELQPVTLCDLKLEAELKLSAKPDKLTKIVKDTKTEDFISTKEDVEDSSRQVTNKFISEMKKLEQKRRGSTKLPVSIDEPVLWTQEQVTLKSTSRPVQKTEKETIEKIELKPAKPSIDKTKFSKIEMVKNKKDGIDKPLESVQDISKADQATSNTEQKPDKERQVIQINEVPTSIETKKRVIKRSIKTKKVGTFIDEVGPEIIEPIEKVLKKKMSFQMQLFCLILVSSCTVNKLLIHTPIRQTIF